MTPRRTTARSEAQLMAYSAAAMYGGAAFVGILESLMPGGPPFSPAPAIAALVVVPLVALVGPRLPKGALFALGPLGAAMIAVSLATTHGHGDGAVLYAWPVLWVALFFDRRATYAILAWIGIVDALALVALPPGLGSVDRWLDVMVTMCVVAGVVRMLSERNQRLLRSVAAEARLDALTGLLNRRGLDERLAQELARAHREGSWIAVVAFDLDHFKWVNDEHGHEVGDLVLARLGQVLREQTRGHDVVARIGGEEFLAVLPQADEATAREVAERVRGALSAQTPPDLPRVTASAGVCAAVAAADAAPLLAAADRALYAAKRGGRDQTVVDGDSVAAAFA
jgi:diguanylate cyclase (GGDEF)-like protein